MRSVSLVATLAVFCVFALATQVWGQSATSLHGTVFDTKGAVITGATVTLENGSIGYTRSTKTDHQGVYQFLQVPPATYTVNISASGFAPLKQGDVMLHPRLRSYGGSYRCGYDRQYRRR